MILYIICILFGQNIFAFDQKQIAHDFKGLAENIEVKNFCEAYSKLSLEEELDFDQIFENEIENFCAQQLSSKSFSFKELEGFSLDCQTINDNSALYFLTKDRKHQSRDEGATTVNECRICLQSKNDRTSQLCTRYSSSLYTDLLTREGEAGSRTYPQRSLERSQVEAVYTWWQSKKLEVGIGAYFSMHNRSNKSFGAVLQKWWHELTGVRIYENRNESSSKKLGGGLIFNVNFKFLSIEAPKHSLNMMSQHKVESGVEAGSFRLLTRNGASISSYHTFFRGRVRPILGGHLGGYIENQVFGDDVSHGLWYGGGIKIGIFVKGRKSSSFEFEIKGAHYENALYGGPKLTSIDQTYQDFQLDRITTQSQNRFHLSLGFKIHF